MWVLKNKNYSISHHIYDIYFGSTFMNQKPVCMYKHLSTEITVLVADS